MLGSVKSAVDQMRHFTVSEPFERVLELEQTATRLTHLQPKYVPGVLQTREYATEVTAALTGRPADDPDVQERVELRTTRAAALRERLRSAEPPALDIVLDRAALIPGVVSKPTMQAQIAHLRELIAHYPSVRLAVSSLRDAGYTDTRGCLVLEEGDTIAATFIEGASADELAPQEVGRRSRDLATSLLAADRVDDEALAKLGA